MFSMLHYHIKLSLHTLSEQNYVAIAARKTLAADRTRKRDKDLLKAFLIFQIPLVILPSGSYMKYSKSTIEILEQM